MHELAPGMPAWTDLAVVLGGVTPRPPLRQPAVELDPDALWHRIDDPPPGLLQNYHTDLAHGTDVDVDVLRHLLPRSMAVWQQALTGWGSGRSRAAAECTGELHAALARRPGLIATHLGAGAQRAVEDWALDSLHAQVSATATLTGPMLDWVPLWAGLSCGLPDLGERWWDRLWAEPDLAAAAIAYVTRISYRPSQNPVFAADYTGAEPWHRLTYITDGVVWPASAVAGFGARLEPAVIGPALAPAVEAAGHRRPADAEIGLLLAEDFDRQVPVYQERKAELLAHLADPNAPDDWSDIYAP